MITIHASSKHDSTTISRTIDPKSKDEFDNDISEIVKEASRQFGKYYLDYDDSEVTEEQRKWLDEEFGY